MTTPYVHVGPGRVSFAGGVIAFDLPEGVSWAEGGRPTHCRSCGAPMLFVRSEKTGKPIPLNPDGTSHFRTCPQAKSWSHAGSRQGVTRPSGDADATTGDVTAASPSGAGET